MGNISLYDRDFYAWANEQASLLRAGKLSEADLENIAEESRAWARGKSANIVPHRPPLAGHDDALGE